MTVNITSTIKISKATRTDKSVVLILLDQFRDACKKIIDPQYVGQSDSARVNGAKLYDDIVDSVDSLILLAQKKDNYVGIITAYCLPQLRKGQYVIEIEECYVVENAQGSGVAQQLMQGVFDWAKEKQVSAVRLESHNALSRAHAFYEKVGFQPYGKSYICHLD